MNAKTRIARQLRRAANRLDPAPPLVYKVESCMTDASAKVIADMLSGQLGGQIGVNYTKPDGTSGAVSRY